MHPPAAHPYAIMLGLIAIMLGLIARAPDPLARVSDTAPPVRDFRFPAVARPVAGIFRQRNAARGIPG